MEAWGNCQIADRQINGNIKVSGNARVVYFPKTVFEFLDFYGISHTKTKATFYKAVRKNNNKYLSYYDQAFEYQIGEVTSIDCDKDTLNDCSFGLHICHLNWALNFGRDWEDLAILEVETKIKDIVLPQKSDGKVRTSSLKVLREVPLEDCGIFGKILAKRRKQNETN